MTGYVNQLNIRGVLTEALAFVVDHADKDEDPEQWTLTRELRAAISAPIADAARVTDEDIDRMAKEMQSPTRPSDRAIALAFTEWSSYPNDEGSAEERAAHAKTEAYIWKRARELDSKRGAPEARAGDCDAAVERACDALARISGSEVYFPREWMRAALAAASLDQDRSLLSDSHVVETMLSAATLLELSTNPIDRAEGAALRRLTTKATP